MLLLGHRGCRGAFTENTFAAFDYAMESGCDGFEFDVRVSADAVPVVWHDARLRGLSIARQAYCSLRSRCAVPGRLPHSGVIALCQLEEVLARYANVSWMDIELKVRGLEAEVVDLVRRHPPARGFVLSSFRQSVLRELHRVDPRLPLALIFDRMPPESAWRALPVQYVKPSAQLVTAARVRQFHMAGMKVLTWTVNHPSMMRGLSDAGVDGMIGDDPSWLAASRFNR